MASCNTDPVKFALVSHVLPPSPSGQAVVLSRLLRDIDPARYCLVSVRDYENNKKNPQGQEPEPAGATQRLRGLYYGLPDEPGFRLTPIARLMRGYISSAMKNITTLRRHLVSVGATRLERSNFQKSAPIANEYPAPTWFHHCKCWIHWIEDLMNIRRQVYQRAGHIFRIITQEQCNALVACSGDLIDLPASLHAARRANVPFYAYMFDDYATSMVPPFQCNFAQEMTTRLTRQAAGVVVPNEFLARAYQQRYGIEPWIIPNPTEVSDARASTPMKPIGRPVRIVYTGAVYEAHYDAILRLISALRSMPESEFELHIYTSTNKESLEQLQITCPAILHDAVPSSEAIRLQQDADVLFLPLAFNSPIPETIKTSAREDGRTIGERSARARSCALRMRS